MLLIILFIFVDFYIFKNIDFKHMPNLTRYKIKLHIILTRKQKTLFK